MMEYLTSPWLPTVAIWLVAAFARILHGSWFAPAAAVGLWWSAYCGIATLLLTEDVYPNGLWVLAAILACFAAGGFLAQAGQMITQDSGESRLQRNGLDFAAAVRGCSWFVALSVVLAFFGILYIALYGMMSFDLSFDLSGLLRLGAKWTDARYITEETEPFLSRLLFMWLYPSALMSGLSFRAATTRKNRFLYLTPFALAVMISLVQATRAGMMYTVGLWFGGYYVFRLVESGRAFPLFTRSFVSKLVLACIAGITMFAVIDVARGGVVEGQEVALKFDTNRLAKYFVGSLPAFTQWWQNYSSEEPKLGAYTFSGVFDLLGLQKRETGLYRDMITLATGEETNLYTCFRGMVVDYTLPGTFLLMFLAGFGLHTAFSRLWQRSVGAVIAVACTYAFIVSSPVVSMFIYNGILLACVTVYVVLARSLARIESRRSTE